MENAKNFILSLKFPFSLVKENRFIMAAPTGAPSEGGGAVDKDKEKKPDSKAGAAVESPDDKKTRENFKRSAEVDLELDTISRDSNIKETQLAKVVDDFQKIPVPVDPDNSGEMVRYEGKTGFEEARQKYAQDKPAYDLKKADYDKQVAAIRLELMGMNSKRMALIQERKSLNAYKDPRVEAISSEMRMEELKNEIEGDKAKFFDGLMSSLNAAKIAERRQEFKINGDKWDVTSKVGLDSWKKDLVNLGIYENTPFFNNIFGQLAKLSDPNELNELKPGEEKMYSSIEEKKKIYLAPEENVRKIGDKALAAAVSFFVAIKDLLKGQDNLQMASDARTQEKDQDKIASTGIKFVTDNVKKFQDAIKQKDWGTALVYVVAGYVAYKGAMKIWEKTPELAKKGIYAAGFLYAVNMFSKNAGYDIGKKLGITAAEDEVRGTSLAYLYGLGKVPEAKDMDGRVLLDIGGTSVSDLNSLYLDSNNAGIRSIDPNMLSPSPFPQFRGMTPNVLRKTDHLTSKEQEYQRVGRELYKIAKVVRDSYDKYIKPKNGLTIEQALSKNSDLKNVSLFNFAMLFKDVAVMGKDRVAGGLLGETLGLNLASYNMRKRLDKVFQDKGMDFEAVHTPLERGVYKAQVMNFPIVIREDSTTKEYIVFSLDDYKKANGNPNAVTQALCKIPFEGNADSQVGVLKDAVVDRFKKVVDSLNKSAKESLNLGEVKYQGGKFVSTLKVEKGSMLGKEETIPVFLKVSKDGSTVEVYRQTDNELIINLDSSGDKNKLLGNLVMAGLCQQDNMKPFFFLYKAKKMEFKGQNMDGSFDVVAGDSKVPIKFKLDKTSGRYVFAEAGAEAKLFDEKNYGFLRELAENAVKENKEWKKETERFKNVLESVPEEYVVNLFKNVPNWWKEATSHKWFRGFGVDQFTGSIPKNYTNAMVEAQAEFLISGMVDDLAGSKSLAGASATINKDADIKASSAKLDRLSTKLSNINEQKERDGKEISSEDFKKNILDDVSKLAVKSETYSLWYEQFSTYIFMKYGKDGIIPGRTNKAAKIVSVFAAYTHELDDKELDGKSVRDPLYKKYATYSNYVAERMFRKLSEDKMPDEVPARGEFWEIDDFDTFDKNWATADGWKKYRSVGVTLKDEEGNEEKGEILVEKEALKMSKDYVSFEDWLGKSAKERKKYNKDNVVLSNDTEEHSVEIKTDKEYAFYLELLDEYEHDETLETIKHTQLQKEFYTALRKGITGLKNEFEDYLPEEGTPKHDKFQKLQDESYLLRLETLTPSLSDGEQTPPFDLTYKIDNNVFWMDTINLEADLSKFAIKNKRAVTKSIQRQFITEKVKKILSERIAGKDVWEEYFEKKTVWNVFSTKFVGFIDKLNLF